MRSFSNTIYYMTSILFACVRRNHKRLSINGSRWLVGLVFLSLSSFVTRDIKFPFLVVRWSVQFIAAALPRLVQNKNLFTSTTISRLVPINIIKLQNNKHFSTINYKVHVCIFHASCTHLLMLVYKIKPIHYSKTKIY
jgi:hypothetical protein